MTSCTPLLPDAAPVGGTRTAPWRRQLAGWLLHAAGRLLAAPGHPVVRTAGGVPRRWRGRHPARLVVTRGALWVTVAGDLRDHAVPAGDALDLPAGTTVWIGSLDARVPADWHLA